MAGMMGMIDLLNGLPSLDHEQQELARIAQESARNLLTVVNNILDFLQARCRTSESRRRSISASSIPSMVAARAARPEGGSTAASFWRQSLAERNAALSSRAIQAGSPRILLNLVGNAIKFTEKGSITIAASHRVLEGDAIELRIEVIDTGVGISRRRQAAAVHSIHAGRQFGIA